jgi:hypothetical protein
MLLLLLVGCHDDDAQDTDLLDDASKAEDDLRRIKEQVHQIMMLNEDLTKNVRALLGDTHPHCHSLAGFRTTFFHVVSATLFNASTI